MATGRIVRVVQFIVTPLTSWFHSLLAKRSFKAFALFALLTILAGHPILLKLDSVLIGNDADVYINPWADWWTLKALTEESVNLHYTDYLFYPNGADLTYHSFSHLNTAVSLLLRPIFGPFSAYNLAILLNYILNGLAMYQFAGYWTRSNSAAILAGTIFAFNPHALYQSSHPVLVSIWPLPWCALFLLQAINTNSKRKAIQAAIVALLAALISSLIFIFLALWIGLLLSYLLVKKKITRDSWRILAIFAGTSAILCLPILFPILKHAYITRNTSYLVDPLISLNSSLTSFVVPHWYIWDRYGLYFGLIPLSLIWFARYRRASLPWYLLLLLAVAFSIGPRVRIGGLESDLILPWSIPLARILRHMYRLSVITSFALAMLVAYGWITIGISTRKKYRNIVFTIMFLLITVDYLCVLMPHIPIQVSNFYTEYLEDVPDDSALAIIPIGRRHDKHYLLYQTFHGHRITGGTISRAAPEVFQFIEQNALLHAAVVAKPPQPIPTDPEPWLNQLAQSNVDYLVIDKTLGLDVALWREAMPVEPIYEDELLLAYETTIR